MTLADDRSSQRSYAENENLTLSEADLEANGSARPYAGGDKLRAYCPVHGGDHQRSLEVDLETGRFYCHNCDCWGYMDWAREEFRRERGLEQDGASTGNRRSSSRRPPVRRLPREAPKPPEPVREDLGELVTRFQKALPGSWGEKYLEYRGVPLELAREYGVGYAAPGEWPGRSWKGGRLVAPHSRPDGTIVNLYGRAVAKGEVQKQRKHDHLSGNKGYWNALELQEGSGPLYVAEGLLDALALIASGWERTVAIFSARDWRWHWLPDDVCQLVLAFDADDTGDEAREKLASEARLRGIEVAYLDADAYGGENDPAAAFAAGTLVVGEWPEALPDIPAADPVGSTGADAGDAAEEPVVATASEPPTTVPEAPTTIPEAVPEAPAPEVAPGGSSGENPGPAAEALPEAPAADPEGANREASKVLYRLYEQGCRLQLRGGRLHAGRDGGLTEAQRELLRDHEPGLTRLLSEEAMSEVWSPALRYVSDTLRRRGLDYGSADGQRAAELLNEAQEAYERGEDGLARYRLRRAALAAAGRLR